jgi:hypothetical protein
MENEMQNETVGHLRPSIVTCVPAVVIDSEGRETEGVGIIRNVSRRAFFGGSLALSSLVLAGCNTQTIVNDVNAVLDAAVSVIAVADPTASWLANLKDSVVALKSAEGTWQNGGAKIIVIDALNTVAAICAVIPITAPYAPLVAVLVAGIDSVISLFGPTLASTTNTSSNIHALLSAPDNPYRTTNKVTLDNSPFRSSTGNFRHTFNSTAKQLPGYSWATI